MVNSYGLRIRIKWKWTSWMMKSAWPWSSGTFKRRQRWPRAVVTDRWAARGWASLGPELEVERASAGAGTGATGSGAPGHRSTGCRPCPDIPPSRGSPLSISISWQGAVWNSLPARTGQRSLEKPRSWTDSDLHFTSKRRLSTDNR